jgi:hypothetical protein
MNFKPIQRSFDKQTLDMVIHFKFIRSICTTDECIVEITSLP